MIISKKKRNSEEFKRLFCTKPEDKQEDLTRADIKRILLEACAKTEKHVNNSDFEIVEEEDNSIEIIEDNTNDFEIVEDNYFADEDDDNFYFCEDYEPNVTDEEVAEYIVENPNEVIVNFPIISDIKLEEKLPFFKSILYKCANA